MHLVEAMSGQGFDWSTFCLAMSRSSEKKITWKMGWLLTHYIERHPADGSKHQYQVWEVLKNTNSHSLQRDLWRAFTFIRVDANLEGELYDLAVKTTSNAALPIAPRAHAMLCAVNVALHYPELSEEMLLVLSSFPQEESPGLRNRAKNLSVKLRKKLREPRN